MEYPHHHKKGQIYFVSNDPKQPPVGSEIWSDRMGLIVSNDVNNKHSNTVMVVYLTTKQKKVCPTHIEIQSGNRKATALCEQIHSVDKSRLSSYNGTITPEEQKDIDKAILFALQISNMLKPTGIFAKWERYIQTNNLQSLMSDDKESMKSLIKERDLYKQLYETKMQQIEELTKQIKIIAS